MGPNPDKKPTADERFEALPGDYKPSARRKEDELPEPEAGEVAPEIAEIRTAVKEKRGTGHPLDVGKEF